MSKSDEALREAFAGESQANRRYLAFAEAADKEGYPQVAKMFRAAAESETVHALSHLRALKAVKDTRGNLQEAIEGETHEFKNMYPAMMETAKSEGNKEALMSFYRANAVEQIHAKMYEGLLDNLGKIKETYSYYVCPVCGYVHEKEAPDACPICGTKGKLFVKID